MDTLINLKGSRKTANKLLKLGMITLVSMVLSGFLYGEEKGVVKQNLASDRNESVDKISKELSNPVSSIYIFPFEYDYDSDIGPNYGKRSTLTIDRKSVV